LNQKKGKTHRLLDFFAGKGFYVVLILCVAAIGASGYMLFFGNSGETPDVPVLALVSPGVMPSAPPAAETPVNPVIPPPSPILPPSSPPPIAAPSPHNEVFGGNDEIRVPGTEMVSGDDHSGDTAVSGNVTDLPSVPPENTETPPPANVSPSFFPPVSGEVIVGFSESADVFYEALREWRYHPGIDIETNMGALVQSAADGVIKEIHDNAPRNMGATVVIQHSGGYQTVYSNLSSTVSAVVGNAVKAGDTIGAVGDTSIAESALPPHLHFEIWKDGEPVDPADYLP
jgi:murein DD-endopeptidase MepM/ murein hydrolase activator NlpD